MLFSAQEDRAEAAIVEGLKARETQIDVSSYGLTASTLKEVYVRALNNNPSLFYVKSAWSYSQTSSGQIVYVMPTYLAEYDESSSARYEEAVQKALESVNDEMNDKEKALALHDYLAMCCAYENDGQGNYTSYNAYDALVNGVAVCQGYTLAYTELLQRVGIGTSYATSDPMNHIWNLIELDNSWYHVDVTWDDPTPDYTGRVLHNNFLRSNNGITEEGHYSWVTGIDGLTCTDDSYASGQFWNDLSTAVIYEGADCYYMSGTGNIVERSGDGSEQNVYGLTDKTWNAWGSNGYWPGIYTGLSRVGNYLYCNDKLHVYRISLSNFRAEEIYSYAGGDGYIYGTRVCDNMLMLAVSQNPNNIPRRMTVELPEPVETFDNLDFTWMSAWYDDDFPNNSYTISSANTNGKLKCIVFTPMTESRQKNLKDFYVNLFQTGKYVEVVLLDTNGVERKPLWDLKTQAESGLVPVGESSAVKYGYDTGDREEGTDGIRESYQAYCESVEAEYNPENPACFFIDAQNTMIDYHILSADTTMSELAYDIAGTVTEKRYIEASLSSPGNLKIKSNKEGRIVLQWDEPYGDSADHYNVYRADARNGKYVKLDAECTYWSDASGNSHVLYTDIVDAVNGNNPVYYYKVVAADWFGALSPESNIATNEGMKTVADPSYKKKIYLVDEDGNEVDSITLGVGESIRLYPEMLCNNGEVVRFDGKGFPSDDLYTDDIPHYSIVKGNDFDYDWDSEYVSYSFEMLDRGYVVITGLQSTDGADNRYFKCSIENNPYTEEAQEIKTYVPVTVTGEGVSDTGWTLPLDCYTDRQELNQMLRDKVINRETKMGFCVPQTIWDEWQEEAKWSVDRDIMDFYKDREGMKSWEGDYLLYAVERQNSKEQGYAIYRWDSQEEDNLYYIVTMDFKYFDNADQEEKVKDKLDELIWTPGGALYQYHDSKYDEYEIVKACMDWIQNNVSYIGTTTAVYHSAYSALYNKKATCEGYSLLLYRMLREFGISNRILMGTDANAHTYNIVEINGVYYFTDPSANILLKGSKNFSHAPWQSHFRDPEFKANITDRISETDYVYLPRNIELYQLATNDGQEVETYIDRYKTFEEAREVMEEDGNYLIRLMGNTSLVTGDELDLPTNIGCELDLKGYTLGVPKSAVICADIYGGDNGKGVIKVDKNQSLTLNTSGSEIQVRNLTISFDAASQSSELKLGSSSLDKPLTLTQVNVTGTPALVVGSNIVMDSASSFAVGALKVEDTSRNTVLDGKLTAKTLGAGALSLTVRDLTVSGETVVDGGFELNVKGNVSFGKVTVQNSSTADPFLINLLKIVDGQDSEISTGAVKFTGALVKDSSASYAVELQRMKAVQGSEDVMESDPFMPEDIIATITAKESVVPTGYFCIPKDTYGRDLCLVREGNALKVQGAILEVSLQGKTGTQKYVSLDEAILRMASDFGNEKGDYTFTFLSDTSLTKNITLPAMVQTLELKTSEKQDNQHLFAVLDLKGYTLSTVAAVKMYEGLQIISSGKRGKLTLTGTAADGQDFYVETLTGDVKWINAIGEELVNASDSRTMLDGVDLSASKGVIVLQTEGSVVLNANISARELRVESGNWILGGVTMSSGYNVANGAEVAQSALTLTNSMADISGNSIIDNAVTLTNTKLAVKQGGELSAGTIQVKTLYKQESAANGYTIENAGHFQAGTLQMSVGTFYNSGTAQMDAISNIKAFVNARSAVLVSGTFNQISSGSSRLEADSVLAVKEKAVLYNIELCGAYFYQLEGCNTAFEGKVTLADEVSDEGIGLRYGVITESTFENLLRDGNENVSVQELAPQTMLFTTKISKFPSTYVRALQPDADSAYTMVYQIGQNIRVGKEWIVIWAKRLDGEEQHLKSFVRWTDAVAYLSDLSNPSLTYIVDILDDVDIEQALTMPAKSAGLIIRGTNMPGEEAGSVRTNVLTYTGDLNLTTNVEFSNIELRAKKNNVDYQSVVTLKGKSLTFSNGASGTFAAINGNATAALVINDSRVEVRGALTVGELRSAEGGELIGLATIKRDKNGNITAVTPQITITGQTAIDMPITVGLQEKVTVNKVVSYEMINFAGASGEQIRTAGIQLIKAVYAQPEDYKVSEENGIQNGTLTKKNGYLLWFDGSEYSVILRYGSGANQTEIPCATFADAVAEINSLKTKQPYTLLVQEKAEEISGNAPAALAMPNKNYISGLRIEAVSTDTVKLYYLGNLTLTTDTVLKDVEFCQMVKVGKEYVPADVSKEDYPAPVTLSTGGFGLTIEGKVRFNTPLHLNGANAGTFTIAKDASLATETNGITADLDNTSVSVIVGSVQKFKTFDIAEGQSVQICQFGTKSAKGVTYTAATLNVTGMTVGGNLTVDNGNATIRDLIMTGGTLQVTGEKAGKAVLTNVTMEGNKSEIFADRDFTISGTLTNLGTNAELYTRQKPEAKGITQMPYLNITGKVVTEPGRQITIGVRPNDCTIDEMAELHDAPQASAQLLTAKSAGVECFAADPDNVNNAGAYGPGNENGYMLVKTGNNIYAYDSDHVVVALCKGTVSNCSLENAEIINYYPGWQEAVAALNALNQKTETYTLLLLKDIGTQDASLSLSMPSKAEKVYVTSVDVADGNSKSIFYRNALNLGTNMEFANVELAPVTAKGLGASLGFTVNNFALTLRDIQVSEAESGMSLKDITGKGKGSVTLMSEGLTFSGGISGVQVLMVQKDAIVTGAVKADTLMLQDNVEFTANGAITVTNIENGNGQNTLAYGRTAKDLSNLTINGTITNSNRENPLQLKMIIPEGKDWNEYALHLAEIKAGGYKVTLSDTNKLAVMPKVSTADFNFCFKSMEHGDLVENIVKANKGLYLMADDNEADYSVGLKSSAKDGMNLCMDLTQAMNEINTLADGTADYTLYLWGYFDDTNITDNNPYGALTMPGNGKAKSVTLTGSDEEGVSYNTVVTFTGNINAYGNLTMKDLCLEPVKSISNGTPADFNISVTGNAKSGASLTLDNVKTEADKKWNWSNQEIAVEETGFINQISGIKNLTNVTIRNSNLRLKTGIANVNELSMDDVRLITCKASTVNNLSMNSSSWDAMGATTITNVTNFTGGGDSCYLATKQAAKNFLPQLTINGRIEDVMTCKVIAASTSVTEIKYVDSYKDVKLAKLPKEAAGKLNVLWSESQTETESGWIVPENRIYYKDTANYVLCGDTSEMAIKLTGTNGEGVALADTYAKCYQDVVTIINNLNDPKASYRIELLQSEFMTGKDGTFGAMTFPANNKAESITLAGDMQNVPVLTFSGNITAYGNVTLENLELCAVKNIVSSVPVDFNLSINGGKDAASLTLTNVQISENGGKLSSVNGNSKASVILNSEGLNLSGSINGVTTLTVKENAVVNNAVKANTLRLQGGIEFTAKGAITVTDIENVGGQNTLAYSRTAKNVTNLTVNGTINNVEGTGQLLSLKMLLPEGASQTAYELMKDPLKTSGFRVVLNDQKKLAVLPKVSTDEFEFSIGSDGSSSTIAADKLVKANKGLYLANDDVAADMVTLETMDGNSVRCLDLNQAVSEINTLADGTASYKVILNGDCEDANVTDANAYSALTMPGNGKAGSVTLKGELNGENTSVLTFSGNITAYGNITMENLTLNPMKGASNNAPADFNITVTGNAKTGASLIMNHVQTAADEQWDWSYQDTPVEQTGFINQISGTKGVTNVTIEESNLRLKTGLTNVNELSLNSARLITCKTTVINNLSMDDSGWDALGATTITNVTHFAGSGDNCYLAAKQAAKTFQPQLTINGMVEEIVTCKVIAASTSVTAIEYVASYKDVKLAKMPKEAAGKLNVLWTESQTGTDSEWVVPGNRIYYKDTANFVLCGDISEMAVKLTGTNSGGMAYIDTYAKCYQDAVTIINNTNDPKALYEIEFLMEGEIRTGKDGNAYGALTLPTKATGVTIRGVVSDTDTVSTYLCYTGTLKPNCPTTFKDLVLTEGAVKKNVYTPTYQITPVLGNVNVTFENVSTMQNPAAGSDEAAVDMVFASASAAKGILTLKNESVYTKGNFVVKELCVSGEAAIIADKAVTLTNITGEAGADSASLVLDTKVTAITKAGQQSLTQLTLNGTISGVEVGVAPRMYDLSQKSYHRLTSYEARAMQATAAKPDVSQKLANLSKTFADFDSLIILYSSKGDSWSQIEPNMNFYNYSNGLYMRP
ncbi:MAG: hypothetical protein K2J99_17355 [Lachnospiraceae bacterium]|nr:hypothetical protein [Lachnospiraceae bacterium]